MARYHHGRRFEYEVRDAFELEGWVVIRSAGSKQKADLVCMRAGVTLLIQCKRGRPPGPAERAEFKELCDKAGFTGKVACRARGKGPKAGFTLRDNWE
jgi:Holliday junction resolvase